MGEMRTVGTFFLWRRVKTKYGKPERKREIMVLKWGKCPNIIWNIYHLAKDVDWAKSQPKGICREGTYDVPFRINFNAQIFGSSKEKCRRKKKATRR
jgi:hypothetical protein